MKYNKIAMLVAGGLMVGSIGTSYGSQTLGAMSGAVGEFGALVDVNTTDYDITVDLDGVQSLSDLKGDATIVYTACYEGNSPAGKNDLSNTQGFNSSTDPLTTGQTAMTISATDVGGYSIAISQNHLTLNSTPDAGALDTIDYRMWVGITGLQGTTDHIDKVIDQACNESSAGKVSVYYQLTDSDLAQHAGAYSLTTANTITLSGEDDDA